VEIIKNLATPRRHGGRSGEKALARVHKAFAATSSLHQGAHAEAAREGSGYRPEGNDARYGARCRGRSSPAAFVDNNAVMRKGSDREVQIPDQTNAA